MAHHIALIPGDGIGPEVIHATTRVVEATGVSVKWHSCLAGCAAVDAGKAPLPQETFELIKDLKVALKGPTETPVGKGFKSVNVALRQELNLFACIRPIKSLPGVPSRYDDIDLVVIRENTEGLYVAQEVLVAPGVVISIKTATEKACTRIAHTAFDYALKNGRKRITTVHKANILKMGDGLFLNCARAVAAEHTSIQHNDNIVDALAMRLVMDPHRFDMLLLENLYGDIVSDLCAGLVGGLGFVPGANYGEDCAVFEAVHGSAPDIAGKNIANPTALILSAALMLDYLNEREASKNITAAVEKVLAAQKVRTADLQGNATTEGFANAVIGGLS